jgi:putative flippase GtrA
VVLVGFLIDLAVFAVLVHWQWGVVPANSAAFLVGSICNAMLVRAYVFDDEHRFSRGVDLIMTVLVNVGVFMCGTVVLAWLVERVGVHPYAAKLMANALTLVTNFSIRALFFRKS